MEKQPLSGPEIRALVREVAERLGPEGAQQVLVLVGGALLAWRGLRDTTADVDTVSHVSDELRRAVASVALHHDLAPDWLNAYAAAFIPATFDQDGCEVLLDHQRLLVLGASLRDVFLMKMYRGLPNDLDDMIAMWPLIGFTDAREVVDAFMMAYPHAPQDEHLAQFVIDIARHAGDDIARP